MPRVPHLTRAEREILADPAGLICSLCDRPGYWERAKPPEQGGDHLITHPGRGWPCTVPRRDPEVKRVLEQIVASAIERRQPIAASSVAR